MRPWLLPTLCVCLLATAGERPRTYSTAFDGTEDPLSEAGKWVNNGRDWTTLRKEGGIAFGTQTGTNTGDRKFDDSFAHLSGFPPDQEAWGVAHIRKPNPSCHQELEILLRFTSSAHRTTGYECLARCLGGGAGAGGADVGVTDLLAAGAFGPGLPQPTPSRLAGGPGLAPVTRRARTHAPRRALSPATLR
jgi:hypothetical protein